MAGIAKIQYFEYFGFNEPKIQTMTVITIITISPVK